MQNSKQKTLYAQVKNRRDYAMKTTLSLTFLKLKEDAQVT